MARASCDVMTTDLRGAPAGIAAPVTGVYAGDDAALPGVRLRPVNGAFHVVMVDPPRAFAAEVEAFLH